MQLWTKGEMKRGVTQSQMCAEWGVGRAERDYWEEKRRQEGCRDGDEGSLGPLWKKGRGERRKATHLSTVPHMQQPSASYALSFYSVLYAHRDASFPELPSATPCVANDVKRRDRVLEARAASQMCCTASAHIPLTHMHTNSPKTDWACHTICLSSFLLSHTLFIFHQSVCQSVGRKCSLRIALLQWVR